MKLYKTLQNRNWLEKLVNLELETRELPPLSDIEKAKLDQSLAVDQLYYSSRLEGSALTKEMIDKAIHGKSFSVA